MKSKFAAAQEQGKKSKQKAKAANLEDKTFGLKNKNKSQKVQSFVEQTTKSIMRGDGTAKAKEDMARKKAAQKMAKKSAEEERDALFGAALLATVSKSQMKLKGTSTAVGRDGNDEKEKKPGTSRSMKLMYQMDAAEMSDRLKEDPNYVETIEDILENARQKKVAELKASGKPGTPVTEETLKFWVENKKKRKADENKKMVNAELKKKKGGKGLSILSGRALYEYNASLFVDDENADDIDTKNIEGLNEGEGAEEDGVVTEGEDDFHYALDQTEQLSLQDVDEGGEDEEEGGGEVAGGDDVYEDGVKKGGGGGAETNLNKE